MSAKGTRAIELLRASGATFVVHEYESAERRGRERDARPSYGRAAAAALGVEPARVFKTLVARVDGTLVLSVVPVDRELDLKALAAACRAHRAELAEPVAAERASGSVIGAISPLAPRRPMPVVIDASAPQHAAILVSAGRRGLQIELAADVLIDLTTATVASIGRAP